METFPQKTFKERQEESDKRTEKLIRLLTNELFNGVEKDELIDAIDALKDEFEVLDEEEREPYYFTVAEKRRYSQIIERIKGVVSKINDGEIISEEELNYLEKGEKDLYGLLLSAHKKFPNFQKNFKEINAHKERSKIAAHSEAIKWKQEQEFSPPGNPEAGDYKIDVPEELKNDPDFQKIQNEIEERAKHTVIDILKTASAGRARGYRGQEEDADKKIRENAEINAWKKFAVQNPEKAKKWAEYVPVIRYILEKIIKPNEKKDEIIPNHQGINNIEEKSEQGAAEKTREGTGNSPEEIIAEEHKKPKSEQALRNERRKEKNDTWEQALRMVNRTTDERVEATKNQPNQEGLPPATSPAAQEEEIEELGEEDIIEQIPYASKEVIEKFSELGINSDELSKIEGFEILSTGQQHLVLDGFKQFVLGQVKEQALEKYNQELKESGFLRRIGKGIAKKYQIAKLEKSTAKDLLSVGLSQHGEILKQLTKATKEQGVDAIINENGEVEIQYASLLDKFTLDRLAPEDKGKIDAFNKSATALSKIPYEWSLDTSSKKQRREFEKIRSGFEAAKMEILNLPSVRAAYDIAISNLIDIENKLRFNQFISTHPEVERELKNIQTQSMWTKIRKDIITERGIYAGVGFGAAGINGAMLLASGFVLPIGSVISGAAVARWRAKETLKERDVMARRGAGFPKVTEEQQKILKEKSKELAEKEQWLKARFPEYVKAENDYLEEIVKLNKKEKVGEAPTAQEVKLLEELKAKYEKEQFKFELDPLFLEYDAKKSEYEKLRSGIFKSEKSDETQKNFVDAKSLTEKIDWLMKKIESEKDEKKLKKLVESLKTRLNYSDKKISDGLVNFGSANERLFNNYNLIKIISDGFAFADSLGNPRIKSELQEKLDKALLTKKEKISKSRKDYIRKKMELGALYAVGFYGLGYVGRKAFGFVYDYWQSLPKTAPNIEGIGEYAMPIEMKQAVAGGRPIAGGGMESVAVGGYKSEILAQKIPVQEIGKRGPEGAIIDYFKTNPDAAKKLGYQKEMDFNKWAGTKAHQLWLKHAQDSIKNPDIQETLKKLGYAPDEYTKGYEEMMRHIQHGGGVKIDISKGNVDLIDVEYLKFKAPAVLEDIPTEPQIDEGVPAVPQIDEGLAALESSAPEAFDNVISVNALPSVEWFALEDMKFSIGEFGAIKNIPVEKLLKEIPSHDEAWEIWRGEVEGKSINLPHYETYWYTQFRRQVNLTEFIRKIIKEQKIKPEILKNISIGKFIEKYIAPNLGAR